MVQGFIDILAQLEAQLLALFGCWSSKCPQLALNQLLTQEFADLWLFGHLTLKGLSLRYELPKQLSSTLKPKHSWWRHLPRLQLVARNGASEM